MAFLTMGVIGTSKKEDERRVPIHPEHLTRLPEQIRRQLIFEKSMLKPGTLIIDVSCDEGMGFYFAKPTSFKKPIIAIDKIDYYAVDHTPSYFWESASRSISAALIVHLPSVIAGRESWNENKTIKNAVNVDKGVIVKDTILRFQNRNADYPHKANEEDGRRKTEVSRERSPRTRETSVFGLRSHFFTHISRRNQLTRFFLFMRKQNQSMITDINVNKPEPIVSEKQLELFNRTTDVKLTIKMLEAGKSVLITAFYSNGLLLLKELQMHLKRKLPNQSFQEQRAYRSEYQKLSNLILIEIVDHKLAVKKSPSIGWLEKLYPVNSDFLLSFPQVQGLNSAWQWYQNGISIPVLRNKIHPYYGVYFPTRFDHLKTFRQLVETL